MKKGLFCFLFVVACTLFGCATSRPTSQVVEASLRDTVYVNKVLYDSVSIDNWYYTYHKGWYGGRGETKLGNTATRWVRDTVFRVALTRPVVRLVEVVREVRLVPGMPSSLGAWRFAPYSYSIQSLSLLQINRE